MPTKKKEQSKVNRPPRRKRDTVLKPKGEFKELVDARCDAFKNDKQVNFITRHRVLKMSVEDSAKAAGISITYGYKINKDFDFNPRFRARIMQRIDALPDDYRSACKAVLPTVLDTQLKGITRMQEDPELAVRHPQLLKQVMAGAGVHVDEQPQPGRVTIGNVEQLQVLMRRAVEDDVVDAEVVALPEPEESE